MSCLSQSYKIQGFCHKKDIMMDLCSGYLQTKIRYRRSSPYVSGLPLPSAKCAKKFHLARLFFIWRTRLAHTFFADIFIFFFVISGMNCASG